MNAREAKAAGKVWARLSLSGGGGTPLLGPAGLSLTGPVDPEAAFVAYLLLVAPLGQAFDETLKRALEQLEKTRAPKAASSNDLAGLGPLRVADLVSWSDRFRTKAEAARVLGVSRSMLSRWYHRDALDLLPAALDHPLGRKWGEAPAG